MSEELMKKSDYEKLNQGEQYNFIIDKYKQYSYGFKINIYLMALSIRELFIKDLWKLSKWKDWDQFCIYELDIKPSTAARYIRVIKLMEEKNIEIEMVEKLAFEKTEILVKANDPVKYLKSAEDMPYTEFRIYYNEHEKGIKPDENLEEYSKKNKDQKEKKCPYWNSIKCECKLKAF